MSAWLTPDWPAPARVRALFTTRGAAGRISSGAADVAFGVASDSAFDVSAAGGASGGRYASFNLGAHVGDAAAAVAANRALLRTQLPAEPLWLSQVHGTQVADADAIHGAAGLAGAPVAPPEADAAVARTPGAVLAILTADCLPVLLCDRQGSVIAAAHAGWRGLAEGVLESAVSAMAVPAAGILAWLGPAIGPRAYEVGADVVDAFVRRNPAAEQAFTPRVGGKFLADLYALARQRLAATGVLAVSGGEACTFTEAARYFSYRRDGVTGRMASLVWIEET